jgi:hypothetical protein
MYNIPLIASEVNAVIVEFFQAFLSDTKYAPLSLPLNSELLRKMGTFAETFLK